MALVVSREGDVQLLTDLLGGGNLETWWLCLFKEPILPSEDHTAATYTGVEADFDGYSRHALMRLIGPDYWNQPAPAEPSGEPPWCGRELVGHSQYGSAPRSWRCGEAGNTIYGYFILGARSGKLICAESFAHPRTLHNNDVLSITPVFENA